MDSYFSVFTLICELIGCVSFSISGAATAIKKNMDLFGVIILGITTACGGGIIRDIILGITPPSTFVNPLYAIVASIAAVFTFAIEASAKGDIKSTVLTDLLMFWMDTIGLAVFTVIGISTAYEAMENCSAYLLIFVGVITGVGGGLLRDMFAQNQPYIFVKHIYAVACIIGSITTIMVWDTVGRIVSMLIGIAVIIVIRCVAKHYNLNLPKINKG